MWHTSQKAHRQVHSPCEWLQLFELLLRTAFQYPRGPCKCTICLKLSYVRHSNNMYILMQVNVEQFLYCAFDRYRAQVTFSTQLPADTKLSYRIPHYYSTTKLIILCASLTTIQFSSK